MADTICWHAPIRRFPYEWDVPKVTIRRFVEVIETDRVAFKKYYGGDGVAADTVNEKPEIDRPIKLPCSERAPAVTSLLCISEQQKLPTY